MKVKSYWMPAQQFSKTPCVGMPVCSINVLTMQGQVVGKIGRVDGERALVVLDVSVPWQRLEEQGLSFGDFEDTED